uniref:Chemokine interleukin-8-like domain-containing protein n=1 Tax=Amazona collaria TaxID=241587 RepID=A0A8B9FSE8_9PSIT
MKVSAAALVALLLVAASVLGTAVPVVSPGFSVSALTDGVPTTCCFTYHQRPIPQRLVISAYVTSSSCSQPGVM